MSSRARLVELDRASQLTTPGCGGNRRLLTITQNMSERGCSINRVNRCSWIGSRMLPGVDLGRRILLLIGQHFVICGKVSRRGGGHPDIQPALTLQGSRRVNGH